MIRTAWITPTDIINPPRELVYDASRWLYCLPELVQDRTNSTKNRISALLARHEANPEDVDVQFLSELEEKFERIWDLVNLKKVREITIFKDYILIAWHKLSRYDIKSKNENEKMWIYSTLDWKNSLFSYGAAQMVANHINWFIPSEREWQKIASAIPTSNEIPELDLNMEKILNLNLSWWRDSKSGKIYFEWVNWLYWVDDDTPECRFWDVKLKEINSLDMDNCKKNWLSLRLILV